VKKLAAYLTVLAMLLSSCVVESIIECDGSTPTYDGEISAIINANCLGSGCHSGGSNGVFTSYAGLQPKLTSGAFERNVLIDRSMPRGSAILTRDELVQIQCWKESGFPEN
jgi:hypothetical protein